MYSLKKKKILITEKKPHVLVIKKIKKVDENSENLSFKKNMLHYQDQN